MVFNIDEVIIFDEIGSNSKYVKIYNAIHIVFKMLEGAYCALQLYRKYKSKKKT